MTELDRINRAFYEYQKRTGIAPTRVYLGHDDYHKVRSANQMYVFFNLGGDEVRQPEIMGLKVYRVEELNHLFVC